MRYPVSTALLKEAQLYAMASFHHTFNWDSHKGGNAKMQRITVGRFAQVWVQEFCRLNGIPHISDASSSDVSDEFDLQIRGLKVDIKASKHADLLGQVAPGPFRKAESGTYFCFVLADPEGTFVEPWGFIEADDYRKFSYSVKRGEQLPTGHVQAFSESFFLPPDAPVEPFESFLLGGQQATIPVIEKPTSIIRHADMSELSSKLSDIQSLMLKQLAANTRKPKRAIGGNVVDMNGDLFTG
jgi:hypothetical protein